MTLADAGLASASMYVEIAIKGAFKAVKIDNMNNARHAIATYEQVSQVLHELKLGISAAELHGSLIGYLCGGGLTQASNWVRDLWLQDAEDLTIAPRDGELFEQLFREGMEDLNDHAFAFAPLLPEDSEPMRDRTLALVEWCRGFLSGIGLTGVDPQRTMSEDCDEILHDLCRIAASRFGEEKIAAEDEDAYVEVVEYVRVGAMLLHQELARTPHEATKH